MTIKIKFRAWDGKEMYQPVINDEGRVAILWYGYEIQGWCDDVVMQYTGLKDSKGKEIYEGDIVRLVETVKIIYEPEFEQMNFIGKIEWDSEGADYNIIGNNEDDFRGLGNGRQEIEVIGNIYENPELLEK